MLRTFATAFIFAAIVGAIATPAVRRLAVKLGAVSVPGGRHIHEKAIPRLGGVAIMAAFVLPLCVLFFVDPEVWGLFAHHRRHLGGLFLGGLLIGSVGFLDDTRHIRALHKLYAQVLVALIAFGAGFRIDGIQLPLIGTLQMGIFALPVTVAWMVGIINAVNLIDGLDGLAGGVVFFACFTNLVIAQLTGVSFVAIIMATMMGAVLGFLFYNFNPARIFMGDSGSYFLGYILAASSLAGGTKASTPVALLVPIIALGLPIFDVLLAIVRRVFERRSIFSPDRGHIHHRLLDMGITHRRAVLILYGFSVFFALAAIATYFGRSWQIGGALLAASAGLFGLVRSAGYFEYLQSRRRQRGHSYGGDVELFRRFIPSVPLDLAQAVSTDEVLGALERFCARTRMRSFELVDPATDQSVHAWVSGEGEPDREAVETRFDLGRDGLRPVELRFCWTSDTGEVSPQSEVLLQVVADLVESRLGVLRSSVFEVIPATESSSQTDAHEPDPRFAN